MQDLINIKILENLSESLNLYIKSHEPITLDNESPSSIRPNIPSKIIHTTTPLRQTGQKITVVMHTNDHCPPHFHAHTRQSHNSQRQEATFNIETSKLIRHKTRHHLQQNTITHIEKWCSDNTTKTELLSEWNLIFGANFCNC